MKTVKKDRLIIRLQQGIQLAKYSKKNLVKVNLLKVSKLCSLAPGLIFQALCTNLICQFGKVQLFAYNSLQFK